jgi:hypothetical protein
MTISSMKSKPIIRELRDLRVKLLEILYIIPPREDPKRLKEVEEGICISDWVEEDSFSRPLIPSTNGNRGLKGLLPSDGDL